MHVGVLIPVFAKNTEDGLHRATTILQLSEWCWDDSVYDEEGNFDEKLDAVVNANAVWDYPYVIAERWYDGLDEKTMVYPGTTVKDFKDKYIYTGFISEQNIGRMFEFVYHVDFSDMRTMTAEDLLAYIMDLPDDTLLYIGSAHI